MKFTMEQMTCKMDKQVATLQYHQETARKQMQIIEKQEDQLERLRTVNSSMAEKMKDLHSVKARLGVGGPAPLREPQDNKIAEYELKMQGLIEENSRLLLQMGHEAETEGSDDSIGFSKLHWCLRGRVCQHKCPC